MPNSKGVTFESYDPTTGQDDLSILYIDGHLERIPLDRGYYYSQPPSWSPNSRFLGFREHRKDDDFLVIYDLETKDIIDPCFSLGTLPLELVWSPDGNKISFTPASNPDERMYIFLLDLVGRMIYRIEKYPSEGPIYLLGWVNWELP
jgi:Tol biopolymer transport system component